MFNTNILKPLFHVNWLVWIITLITIKIQVWKELAQFFFTDFFVVFRVFMILSASCTEISIIIYLVRFLTLIISVLMISILNRTK